MASKAGAVTCIGIVAVLIVAIVLMAVSFKRLSAEEEAVMYDSVARKFLGVRGQGMYAGPPGYQWIIFPAVFKAMDLELTCNTRDGLPVNLSLTYQYVPQSDQLESIAKRFRNEDKYEGVLQQAAASAIHLTCGDFNVSDYQGSRPIIQTAIEKRIKSTLLSLNAEALAAQLVNVAVPGLWDEAVFEKQKAQQDVVLAENQREQSLYQAQNNVDLATQDALITAQTATANASIIIAAAQQNAAAVRSQYASVSDILVGLTEAHGLPFDQLLGFMQNSIVRSNPSVDMVVM